MDSSSSNNEKHVVADLTPKDHRKHYESPRLETLGALNGFAQIEIRFSVG